MSRAAEPSPSVADRASGPPEAPASDLSAWIAERVEGLAAAWERGEPGSVEAILDRHPGLPREAAIRLVFEAIGLARDLGRTVDTDAILARHPEWRGELDLLLECDRLLRTPVPVAFPEVGDTLGDFRLLDELGRGGLGRTYLAAQPSLADRLVALKVVPAEDEEHLSLARLQHTHIVPLYSEQAVDPLGLRALCMPYLGGASLDRILQRLAPIPPEARTGVDLSRVIHELERGRPGADPAGSAAWAALGGASYVQAICWIASCLAEALDYAHRRGLVHMDIKPSNVLIAGDGQPMLLDFHLARHPIEPGEPPQGRLGGTPGWMSPEQERAMRASASGRPVADPVDARTDIYALGLLLVESLGGTRPGKPGRGPRSLRCGNPAVSPGLADVVARCLADDPRRRYPDAALLAGDLRRHLQDRPLAGVPNRDWRERWAKWRRRHPHAYSRSIAWVCAGITVAGAIGLGIAQVAERTRGVQRALDRARAERRQGRFAEADRDFGEAASAARWAAMWSDLPALVAAERDDARDEAEYREVQATLHGLADEARFQVGPAAAAGPLRAALREFAAVWDDRSKLLHPAGSWADEPTRATVRDDLRALFVLAMAAEIGDHPEPTAAEVQAWRDEIDEAEHALGTGPALAWQRRRLAGPDAAGDPMALISPEGTAADFEELGRALLRDRRYREASAAFDRAIDLSPSSFWSHFDRAVCRYESGDRRGAEASLDVCVALSPSAGPVYYNRAFVRESLGDDDGALRDYDRALRLQPGMVAALLNRGRLHRRAGRIAAASADFEAALAATDDPDVRDRIRQNLRQLPDSHGRATSVPH